MEKREWVSVEELRKEGADVSHLGDLMDVRFPGGWWCNNPPGTVAHIPAGFERGEGEAPVMMVVGGFFAKYNPADERTVYKFPTTWLSRLPRTARINMLGTWEAKREAIRAKRESSPEPMTYQEMRASGKAPVGSTEYGTNAAGGSLLADKAALDAEVEARVQAKLAEIKAAEEAKKEELKQQRLANLKAAREKKKAAKSGSTKAS